ncbi:MAG: S-layer homology domain-containing protein, partial [Clostridia bacterium]|nr:S-layer homology domain-containing protein [Clostridia bacterium]
MKRRICSLLMAIVMVIGMLPMQAFAADSYQVKIAYNDTLCDFIVYDINQESAEGYAIIENGGWATAVDGYASAIFEIKNIAQGYRIKSVSMNGEDWSESFIDGGYGGIARSFDSTLEISVELEEIPSVLPKITGVNVYDGTGEGNPLTSVNFLDGSTIPYLKSKVTFDTEGIPTYHAGTYWYYSLDGSNYKRIDSWGCNNDFNVGWSGHESTDNNPVIDFETLQDYYIKVLAVGKTGYSQADSEVWSAPIEVNHTDCAHEWDGGVVKNEVSSTADGSVTYTCEKCGGTKVEIIAAGSGETADMVPAVTNINTSDTKLYWNGIDDNSEIEHLLLEYSQDNGESWKTFGKFRPSDSGVEYWKTLPYAGLQGTISCWKATTVATAESGKENSIYMQDWGITTAVWEEDSTKPVTVSYVENGDAYDITLSGLTSGNEYIIYNQAEKNFTSNKLLEPLYVKATGETHTFSSNTVDSETNYIVYQYAITGNQGYSTYTFTDVSGWNEIIPAGTGSGETQTGYKLTFVEPTEGSCTLSAKDRNNNNALVENGGYFTAVDGYASAIFEIKNIEEGYRIKEVLINDEDFTENFIRGSYGGMAISSIKEDITIMIKLEEIPENLPVLKSISLYTDSDFTQPLGENTDITIDTATTIYVKPVFEDGNTYPAYTARGWMEYSLDGEKFNWTEWGGYYEYFPLNSTFYSKFNPLEDSYDFYVVIKPDNLYCTGETITSATYHVNGGAGSGEETAKATAPKNATWNKKFYYPFSENSYFDYTGSISWQIGDMSKDQKFAIDVYKDDEVIWSTTYNWYASSAREYVSSHDFALSELENKENGEYYFTVQTLGDDTTEASDIVKSEVLDFTKAENKLAAPSDLSWTDTVVANWNEVENAGGYHIQAFYSEDNGSATSTDDMTLVANYVSYTKQDSNYTSFDVYSWMSQNNRKDGYYYFKVKSVTTDAETVLSSDWSALSPAYAKGVGSTELTKEATPTNAEWHKYYIKPYGDTDFIEYTGSISWKPGADTLQKFEICLFKDEREIIKSNVSLLQEHISRFDFPVSYLETYGSGEYYFTVQAIGDGTTTADSDILVSSVWTYVKPTDNQLTAPENLRWTDTTVMNWDEAADADGYQVQVLYSADKSDATSADELAVSTSYVTIKGEDGDNTSIDFSDRVGDDGYYYFRVKSLTTSADTTLNSEWSDLSPAYAKGVGTGGTTPEVPESDVLAVAEAFFSNGGLRVVYRYAENTEEAFENADYVKAEIWDGENWVTIMDNMGIRTDGGEGNFYVTYNSIQHSVPAGHYTKLRFTTVAKSGYTDAVSEFDFDLTINRETDKNAPAKITSITQEEGSDIYTVKLTGLAGKPDGVIMIDENEDLLYCNQYIYFSEYKFDGDTADSIATLDTEYINDLTEDSKYIVFTISQDVQTTDTDSELAFDATTASVTLTDVSGWKPCFTKCEHQWNDGEVTTEATCGEAGVKTFTCTLCGETKTESVPATEEHEWDTEYAKNDQQHWFNCTNPECTATNEVENHSSDNKICDVDSVCECGYIVKYAGEHTFPTEWQTNETHHWKECTVDGCTGKEEAEHTVVIDEAVPPTETTDGKTEGSHCGVCGYEIVKQETIPALTAQNVRWVVSEISPVYGDFNFTTNQAVNFSANGGALTYSSSDESVATVDANGKATIVGAGECEIIATAAAVPGKYIETSASYKLIVNKAPLTIKANNKSIAYGEAPANDGWTATDLIEGETADVVKGTAAYTYNYEQFGKAGTYEISVSGLTADNYEITFEKGALTVNKASDYTITLGNLEQLDKEVTAVTAAIAPQDATAVIKVEYKIGEEWVETLPTEAGEYEIRASLVSSDNIATNDEYTTATLVVNRSIAVGDTNIEVNVDGEKAEIVVTPEELDEIIEKTEGEVTVELGGVENVTELEIPGAFVDAVSDSEKTDGLVINTEDSSISMSEAVVDTVAENVKSGEDTIAVKLETIKKDELNDKQQAALNAIPVDAVIVEVSLIITHADGSEPTELHELGGDVEVTVPYEGEVAEGEYIVVSYVSNDGNVSYVFATYDAANKQVTFKTNHFSNYAIFVSGSPSVFVNEGTGGGIYEVGATVTIKADEKSGYTFAGWEVNVGTVTLADASKAETTFAMPSENVEVTATYRKNVPSGGGGGSMAPSKPVVPEYVNPFTDVKEGDYFFDAVKWAVENGITTGTTETTFSPDMECTRAQAVTFLYRAAGSPAAKGDMPFADIA